jgi:putative transposase
MCGTLQEKQYKEGRMDEDAKKEIAVFRFGVIADLVGRRLNRGEKERILREKTSSLWDIPRSGRSYVSRSTILSWLRRYEGSGRRLESLSPDERADKGKARVLDEETVAALVALKKDRPGVSLPLLMKEATQRGIVCERHRVSYATVYRLFKRHGLTDEATPVDRRRFEAELPNDLWQSDCLHGPKALIDGTMRKTYLFAFIDDKSRLIPHAEFYGHERLDAYCDALRTALKKRGLPRKLYVDNGPAFRSQLLSHATASLGIALIHATPYQPEGKGKIERWFKTVRMQFLPTVPEGLPLSTLNEALRQWIEVYHATVHSSTRETPLTRYLAHLHLVRETPKDMDDCFRMRTLRKVDKDRTVSLMGRIYEAPVVLMGKMVTLLYHEKDHARVEVFFNGTSYGMLVPLDVHINARVRRSHFRVLEMVPPATPEKEPVYEGGKLFGKGVRDE